MLLQQLYVVFDRSPPGHCCTELKQRAVAGSLDSLIVAPKLGNV